MRLGQIGDLNQVPRAPGSRTGATYRATVALPIGGSAPDATRRSAPCQANARPWQSEKSARPAHAHAREPARPHPQPARARSAKPYPRRDRDTARRRFSTGASSFDPAGARSRRQRMRGRCRLATPLRRAGSGFAHLALPSTFKVAPPSHGWADHEARHSPLATGQSSGLHCVCSQSDNFPTLRLLQSSPKFGIFRPILERSVWDFPPKMDRGQQLIHSKAEQPCASRMIVTVATACV